MARRESGLELNVERWKKEAEIQSKRNSMEMRRWVFEWQAAHPGEKSSVKFVTAMKEKMYQLTGRHASTLDFLLRQNGEHADSVKDDDTDFVRRNDEFHFGVRVEIFNKNVFIGRPRTAGN